MFAKKNWVTGFIVIVFLGFVTPATAQMKRIYRFQNVKLPFNLQLKDSTIRKGTYHFEFLRHQTQAKNYLRICKGRKFLCCVRGDELQYATNGRMKLLDPDIPKNPRMEMFRDPRNGMIRIVFESGKKTRVYPLLKAKFELPIQE